jgi:hypothetical protein
MEVRDIRRANMEALATQHGTLEQLADKVGTSPRTLSQIRNRTRHMGRELARKFEEALAKPHGWMDTAHTVSTPPGPVYSIGPRVREAMAALSPDVVGKLTGSDVREVRHWMENGNIPQPNLERLIGALRRSLDLLTGGSRSAEHRSSIDAELFTDLNRFIESELAEREEPVDPDKKAHAFLILYETFSAIGRADRGTVARVLPRLLV